MRRYELPTTYDDLVLPGRKFLTASYRIICSDCVNGNRSSCSDPNSPEWFIIGQRVTEYPGPRDLETSIPCDECIKRVENVEEFGF